jgi:hypothetical protein
MDLTGILDQLREQLPGINESIAAFERLTAQSGSRRGRPPKWLQEAR